jgi:hypothetical protein
MVNNSYSGDEKSVNTAASLRCSIVYRYISCAMNMGIQLIQNRPSKLGTKAIVHRHSSNNKVCDEGFRYLHI